MSVCRFLVGDVGGVSLDLNSLRFHLKHPTLCIFSGRPPQNGPTNVSVLNHIGVLHIGMSHMVAACVKCVSLHNRMLYFGTIVGRLANSFI